MCRTGRNVYLYQYRQHSKSHTSPTEFSVAYFGLFCGIAMRCVWFSLAWGRWNILLHVLWCRSSCLRLDCYYLLNLRSSQWLAPVGQNSEIAHGTYHVDKAGIASTTTSSQLICPTHTHLPLRTYNLLPAQQPLFNAGFLPSMLMGVCLENICKNRWNLNSVSSFAKSDNIYVSHCNIRGTSGQRRSPMTLSPKNWDSRPENQIVPTIHPRFGVVTNQRSVQPHKICRGYAIAPFAPLEQNLDRHLSVAKAQFWPYMRRKVVTYENAFHTAE